MLHSNSCWLMNLMTGPELPQEVVQIGNCDCGTGFGRDTAHNGAEVGLGMRELWTVRICRANSFPGVVGRLGLPSPSSVALMDMEILSLVDGSMAL